MKVRSFNITEEQNNLLKAYVKAERAVNCSDALRYILNRHLEYLYEMSQKFQVDHKIIKLLD